VTYDVEFISEYCCACVKTVLAHPVLLICSRGSDCIMKVGWYNVNSMLSSNLKEFKLVGAGYLGEVWGWLIHAVFVFVVEMPVYICSHSPWWVTECKFKMLSPLVRALGLKIFLV